MDVGKLENLLKFGKHVLYVEADIHPPTFVSNVRLAVQQFDPTIPKPQNIHAAIRLLWWLMHSGVWVIIDEWQRIKQLGLLGTLQSLLDAQQNYQGSLICLGSQVSDIDWILYNGGSELYGCPHLKMELHSFDYGSVFEMFSHLKIDTYKILDLVSCFDGIIGMYHAFFKEYNFLKDNTLISFTNLKNFITSFFEQDVYYQSQLHSKHSRVLEMCVSKTKKKV